MRTLITRSLFLHFSSPAPILLPPLRPTLLLFLHTGAGEEPLRRRTETYSSSSYSPRRYHDEERNVKVAVWWDFENCNVPVGVNVFRVAQRITSALRSSGIKGAVTITAFGDVCQLSRSSQEALTSTGVCLTHVPHSGKNSSDHFFIADLVYWVSQNPPPAHFFLISGDKDFANILHRLRMSNYNILLSTTDTAPGVLCSAATLMWPWNGLVRGEEVPIKHFNHPPDGLYGSWYGHYKGVLDDPFGNVEQAVALQPEESADQISDIKPRPVPKALMNGIRQVLHLYPEGINLSELRSELKRNNITMDKDFYGHKKFSHLLSSLPGVLKFIPPPSGGNQPLVVGAFRKVAESVELSSKPAKESDISHGDKGHTSAQNEKSSPMHPTTMVEPPSIHKEIDVDSISATSTPMQGKAHVVEAGLFEKIWRAFTGPRPTKATRAEPVLPSKETDKDTVGAYISHKGSQAVMEEGFFYRIWKSLAGSKGDNLIEKNDTISEVESATREDSAKGVQSGQSANHSEKVKSKEKDAQSKSSFHPPGSDSSSSDANKLPSKDNITRLSENFNDDPGLRKGLFSQIISRWKFRKSGAENQGDSSASVKEVPNNQATDANGECLKASAPMICPPEDHDLFSKPSFWYAMGSFFQTEKGSDIILKSRTRGHLARGLLAEGPLVKNLKESHLLQLVDLLISEKKWVEESASEIFPFKLTTRAPPRCAPSHAHGPNGLSSLFTGKTSQSNSQRLLEQEKLDQNTGFLGNSYNGGVDATAPRNVAELKSWFQNTCNGGENIEPEDFQKLFESNFNRKLVCSWYGYPTVRSLIAACLTDQEKKKRPPNREEVLLDCQKLLTELLEVNPDGFNMSIFRPRFILKYGYGLDCEMLGYPKLASLLQIMPEVRIESSFIVPSGKFRSDSGRDRPFINEVLTGSPEDKGSVAGFEEGLSNGNDCTWEELGPISNTVTRENDYISQGMDKEASFNEGSLSEEEFSDSEDDTAPQCDGSEGQRRRGEEDSSLLQILDSWYKIKEGGEKDRVHAADGLVDCSRNNPQDLSNHKPTDLLKLKGRPQKRYSFVSSSGDGEKEKLIENLLGSVKKAGDSKLQS